MPKCGLCQKQVAKLKTNSHIMPRWIMRSLKDDRGRYVFLDDSRVSINHQTDLKADIVCDSCEDLFTADDTWATSFFRDRLFFKERISISNTKDSIFLEVHDKSCKQSLLKFCASVILRYDLYLAQQKKPKLLGPYFDKVKVRYLTKEISVTEFPFMVSLFDTLRGAVHLPLKQRWLERNTISLFIYGYRIFVYFSNRPPTSKDIYAALTQSQSDLLIPIIEGADNAVVKNLAKRI